MKWYTCIIHVPNHISPVQYFHTRGETPQEAECRALEFLADPQHPQTDVAYVFAGRLEPEDRGDAEPVIRCEHGVPDGEWCEPCNKEIKRARNAPENQ